MTLEAIAEELNGREMMTPRGQRILRHWQISCVASFDLVISGLPHCPGGYILIEGTLRSVIFMHSPGNGFRLNAMVPQP